MGTSRSDETRDVVRLLGQNIVLEVLEHLAAGPRSVTDLADDLELHVGTVSKALKQLQTCGYVAYERQKKHHIFHLTDRVAIDIEGRSTALVICAGDGSSVRVELGLPVVSGESPSRRVAGREVIPGRSTLEEAPRPGEPAPDRDRARRARRQEARNQDE